MSEQEYFIGVDVGTGSARAALVTCTGFIVASSTQPTRTWRDPHDHRIFEQSTTNIWNAISVAVHECLSASGIHDCKSKVKGIGFDATCSLAVTDFEGEPRVVTKGESLGQKGERNIILWADHRAEAEAELINKTGSVVLDYVGGTMSLEMEIPKILWLKNNMSPSLFSTSQFFDLPDYLTYKATHDPARSTCSLTCKTSYLPHNDGWQKEFFHSVGLDDVVEREFGQIGGRGEEVLFAGMPVGNGLSKKAADELGLVEGTPVGSAIIDAYAGWLGTVAARHRDANGTIDERAPTLEDSGHRLAAVAGTSTCHIVQSPKGIFVPGVWGPYKDPIVSGWWMNEGGQSSTGQLIDFILTSHPAYPELVEKGKKEGKNIFAILDETLEHLRVQRGADSLTELVKDLHLYPDFHGNRSPIADPRMRGSIVGLELSTSLHSLSLLYHTTLLSIALQTRHIISTLNSAGHTISQLVMSGGQVKNLGLMRMFAEVCGVEVVLPGEYVLSSSQDAGKEGGEYEVKDGDGGTAVVLGSAMLGRLASLSSPPSSSSSTPTKITPANQAHLLWSIMSQMTPPARVISPSASAKEKKLIDAKYAIFLESIDIQKRWRGVMEEAAK